MVRVVLLLSCLCSAAWAGTTTRWPDSELLVDRWSTADGLPLDHIIDLAVSPAGLVWLATFDGLVRFDGQEFRNWRRSALPDLPSNRLVAVAVDTEEQPWVVTEAGDVVRVGRGEVAVWRVGSGPGKPRTLVHAGDALWLLGREGGVWRLTDAGPVAVPGMGPDVLPLAAAAVDGEVWIGTAGHGVWRVTPAGRVEPLGWAEGPAAVRQILAAPDGGAWLASDTGVWRAGDDGAHLVAPERGSRWTCTVAWSDRLWVLDDGGWWTWDAHGVRELDHHGVGEGQCRTEARVYDGVPWRPTHAGLARGEGADLPLAAYVRQLDRAPDGAVWIATNGDGLWRARVPTVTTIRPDLGNVPTALVAPDGTVWGRRWDGQLLHFTQGGDPLPAPSGLTIPGRWVWPAMGVGPSGKPWLSVSQGSCEVDGETCTWVTPVGGPDWYVGRALLATSDGRVWFGREHTLSMGTPEGDGFRWEDVPVAGLASQVATLVEAPDGALWAGSLGSGVFRHDASGWRRWTRAEGLSSDRIRAIWPAPGGELWLGTEDAGMCRLDPASGAVACLGERQGLFDDSVHSVVPDGLGRLWMSSNRGLFWVRVDQLEHYAAGRAEGVLSLGLDTSDGMVDREANGGAQPAWGRDASGRLWYPTQAGLARVDPALVPFPEAPRVLLDGGTVAGRPVAGFDQGGLVLTPDQRVITVRWTASASAWADQVRFRHRLVGQDDTWSAPSTMREARWTSLPPGDLRVEVQAGLAGDWGPAATLSLHRTPAFVETRAFLASLLLGGLAVGGVFAAWRGAVGRRRQAALEATVRARTADLARSNQALEAQAALLEQKNGALAAASARLAEVDAMRTRLIADLSHELRTPLTLIGGPLEDLAGSGEIPEGPARRRLDVVLDNTRRLEELVDQLLDVARLEAGKIRLRVRHLALGELLARVVARFSPEGERKGLTLALSAADAAGELYFDADLVDKVVSNLLSNALKFTPAGGRVDVRLLAPADEDAPVRVEVRDTGPGVEEGLRDRLFDRFFQGDSGDARRFEGVGIGLALARDLVHLHGGEIGVDSRIGEGSCFWFTLPRGVDHLAPDDIAATAEPSGSHPVIPATRPAPSPPEPDGDRPLVLVVEDHPDMRDYLVAHLRKLFAVTAAASGAEALALARAAPPAAIVSDVMMPEMDGLELCRRLRADPALAHVPVLLASAKVTEDDRVAGLSVADDYVTKPLRMRELVARVQKLVARGRSGATVGGAVAASLGSPAALASRASPPSPASPDLPDPPASPDPLGPADLQLRARIEAAVAANLADQDFGVEELARVLALSRRQLLREVQRVTGHAPSDLLRVRRMEEGHRLLERGEVSTVGEAAARVGLSAPYFSRTYTAWYQRAPSELLQRGHLTPTP